VNAPLAPAGFAEAPAAVEQRGIPFDYAFTFRLDGTPDRLVSAAVTVSIEGPFVARSIGYGMVPDTPRFRFGLTPTAAAKRDLPGLSLRLLADGLERRSLLRSPLTAAAERELRVRKVARTGWPLAEMVLRSGFRLNPETADVALDTLLQNPRAAALSAEALENLFESIAVPPELFQFRYALHDQGSGRAFQSDPILNTAGLGIADGGRPFRELVPPITFAPQTSIRMDVTEVSPFPGTLHVALHGYKTLGASGTPTDLRRLRRRARR
jgi:hypothetical protein